MSQRGNFESAAYADSWSRRYRLGLLLGPDTYRRDRRKDRLLQQNGYLFLRFLAEDIGKDFDGVWIPYYSLWAGRERSRPNIMRVTK